MSIISLIALGVATGVTIVMTIFLALLAYFSAKEKGESVLAFLCGLLALMFGALSALCIDKIINLVGVIP